METVLNLIAFIILLLIIFRGLGEFQDPEHITGVMKLNWIPLIISGGIIGGMSLLLDMLKKIF